MKTAREHLDTAEVAVDHTLAYAAIGSVALTIFVPLLLAFFG